MAEKSKKPLLEELIQPAHREELKAQLLDRFKTAALADWENLYSDEQTHAIEAAEMASALVEMGASINRKSMTKTLLEIHERNIERDQKQLSFTQLYAQAVAKTAIALLELGQLDKGQIKTMHRELNEAFERNGARIQNAVPDRNGIETRFVAEALLVKAVHMAERHM